VPEHAVFGQIMQADLAKIGVTIVLKPIDPNQLSLQLYNTSFSGLAFSGQPFAHMRLEARGDGEDLCLAILQRVDPHPARREKDWARRQ